MAPRLPDEPEHEMAYAVHTRTCTYLLDGTGVCRWVVSVRGAVPQHIRQCIGAQFVACLDLEVDGGLVAELRPGARGLLVRNTGERMVLLRTGNILQVDDRRFEGKPRIGQRALASGRTPAHGGQAVGQYGKRGGYPHGEPAPSFGVVKRAGEEQTITVPVSSREAPTERRRR
jgi:hypothetical protein